MIYNNNKNLKPTNSDNKVIDHKKTQVAFDGNKISYRIGKMNERNNTKGNFNELSMANYFLIIINSKNDSNDIINAPFVKLLTHSDLSKYSRTQNNNYKFTYFSVLAKANNYSL